MVQRIKELAARMNGHGMGAVMYGLYFLTLVVMLLAALFGVNGYFGR